MTTPAQPATRKTKTDNVFTRKIGPLPMWGWLLIGLGLIGIYVIYSYRRQNQSSSSTSTGTATGATTSAAQVPQFVNQTYTYGTAPSAPAAPSGNQAHKNWKGSGKPVTTGGKGSSTGTGTTTSSSSSSSSSPGAPVTGANGTTYYYVPTLAESSANQNAGITQYYQSSPGVFTALAPGQNPPAGNTALYIAG